MNTGLGDTADAAWKLAGRLRGWSGEALLDAYEAERRPVVQRNVAEATANYRRVQTVPGDPAIAEDSEAGHRARARAAEAIYTGGHRREYDSDGLVLGACYDGSPIIVPDGTAAPGDELQQSARPGHRAPHAWLAPGRSTLDLFGDGFTLLRFGSDGGPVAASFADSGVPLRVVAIADPAIAALYEAPLVLVRPDGHVAWRGRDAPPGLAGIVSGAGSAGVRQIEEMSA